METHFTLAFFYFIFVRHIHLEYSSSNDSGEFDKEEYDKLGHKSGSAGTFGTGLGGLLHGIGLTVGATIFSDESCDGDGGSLAVPQVKMFVEHVPEITTSFLLNTYQMNNLLILCFLNRQE